MDDESTPKAQPPSSAGNAVAVRAPATPAPADASESAELDEGTIPLAPVLLDFLQSDRGHQLANKGLDLIDGIKRATLDERAKAHALDGELKRLQLRQTWLLKTLGLVIVVCAIVALSATNTLRPEAATILGAVAGYLFAQQSKGSSS
jgi:hypothetical protein